MPRLRADSLLDQGKINTKSQNADSRLVKYLRESPLFSRCFKHERPETRTVRVGHRACAALDTEAYVPEKYINNRVISTKYTLLTFLPINLFEQFRRIANFYFLLVGLVQLLIDTPVTPITSILPLAFVISVTAVKQGYEDWLRHKADQEVNNRRSAVVEDGRLKDCKSQDIKVGDIVRVQVNEEFPCDMVMLSSNDPEGKCYITTANLDGETNLKTQTCIAETRRYQTPGDFAELGAVVECQQPVADLYTFVGRIRLHHHGNAVLHPLTTDNILLRGARLRNTSYIYGCAIYTGQETKMALNSKFKKTKFSQIERRMNTFLILFMVLLFVLSSLFTGLKHWYTDTFQLPWYVPPGKDDHRVMYVLEDFLSFMILFYYIIPISLYVTVEVQKFAGSLFFSWDLEMYDEKIDARALANTSDLNEELGQVEYLFTDKTGTLTENNMCFRMCSVDGKIYEEMDGRLCHFPPPGQQASPISEISGELEDFFTVLALCHTVRVDRISGGDEGDGASAVYSATGDDYDYQASSPDEKALVEACRRYGILFHGMKGKFMEVTFQTTMRRYRLLHILEFSPVRRCMSVIVENEEGQIYLLCKGAELALFNKLAAGQETNLAATKAHVDQFAMLGMRTLAVAHKKLGREEFDELDILLREAQTALQDRETKLEEAYNVVERDLHLLGMTAVEDRLQSEVPETITALRHAGIKVWVLTGDKEETAVNISYSTGHFNGAMVELRLTAATDTQQCRDAIADHLRRMTMSERGEEYVLIMDGQTLTFALADHRSPLLRLCHRCVAVLCCRMSPIQKAQVVRLIKRSSRHPVTAAIGDGANDVSMIQEADVGLGIMGREGRQAVQNSDYGMSQFRFLRRAFLVHGHYYYIRLSTLVLYFFYKNVAVVAPQVFFQFFAAFSEQSIFHAFFLLFYNITFTALPILVYSIFEQHLQQDHLVKKPMLYRRISRNSNLSWLKFTEWFALGLWHGAVCFFGGYLLVGGDVIRPDGKLYGLMAWGSIIQFAIIFVVNIKLALFTYYWSWPVFASFAFCMVGNLAMSFVVTSVIWPDWVTEDNSFYWVQTQVMSSGTFWLYLAVTICVALLPDLIMRVVYDMRNHRTVYKPPPSSESSSPTQTEAPQGDPHPQGIFTLRLP